MSRAPALMHSKNRRPTLFQIHQMSPAQRTERVLELLAKAVALRLQGQPTDEQKSIRIRKF